MRYEKEKKFLLQGEDGLIYNVIETDEYEKSETPDGKTEKILIKTSYHTEKGLNVERIEGEEIFEIFSPLGGVFAKIRE